MSFFVCPLFFLLNTGVFSLSYKRPDVFYYVDEWNVSHVIVVPQYLLGNYLRHFDTGKVCINTSGVVKGITLLISCFGKGRKNPRLHYVHLFLKK